MAQQIVKVKNLKNSIFGDIVFCWLVLIKSAVDIHW
jgi:hypothetical protein